jgi:hypothetical protein
MTGQQYAEARTPAVLSLPPCGDAEQDHLIDEIQHPDLYDAIHALAARCGDRATPSRPPGS